MNALKLLQSLNQQENTDWCFRCQGKAKTLYKRTKLANGESYLYCETCFQEDK
jgi:hypothetical protein